MSLKWSNVRDEKSPLFIFGPSRSGTTLLATVLDNHPEIAILPETWAFVLAESLGCTKDFTSEWQYTLFMNDIWDYVHATDPAAGLAVAETAHQGSGRATSLARLLEEIGRRYLVIRSGKLWGEKTPPHLLRLDTVLGTFPKATIVRIARDPRDILASYIWAWNKGENDDDFVMTSTALVLRYFRELLDPERWRERTSLIVRYEDLVAGPISTLERVCDFLGVSCVSETLELSNSQRAQRLSSRDEHRRLIQAIDSSSLGRYKDCLDRDQIALVEFIFEEYLQSLGYVPNGDVHLTRESRARARTIVRSSHKIQRGWRNIRGAIRGQARLTLHRLVGRTASIVRGRKIAVSRDEWHRRVSDLTHELKLAGH